MNPLNALVFGLGLFFLGMRLIGDNLRHLVGGGFREVVKRSTESLVSRVFVGTAAGALMQSATAVTFISATMVSSGLLGLPAAAVIIVWCNAGLTAMAFLATLNISSFVAYLVGGAGIVMGVIRNRNWQLVAGTLLGLGLILCGLEQMSGGAAPLKDQAWFRTLTEFAASQPAVAFLSGIVIAAILQLNTGTAMLVITLAGAGAFGIRTAMPLIYGANLGAILLRALLSAGMRGDPLRLVRLEDLFCVWSGVLMLLLYVAEQCGVPLVAALATHASAKPQFQLAIVFMLSNLLPALTLTPFLPKIIKILQKVLPAEPAEEGGKPKYLTPQALDEPVTALDLVRKENARLLRKVRIAPDISASDEENSRAPGDFATLSKAIEDFDAQLASEGVLTQDGAITLHRLRAELSLIRHVEETTRYFNGATARVRDPASHADGRTLGDTLTGLIQLGSKALESRDPVEVADFYDRTRRHGGFIDGVRKGLSGDGQPDLPSVGLSEDFEIALWTIHRLAKLVQQAPTD